MAWGNQTDRPFQPPGRAYSAHTSFWSAVAIMLQRNAGGNRNSLSANKICAAAGEVSTNAALPLPVVGDVVGDPPAVAVGRAPPRRVYVAPARRPVTRSPAGNFSKSLVKKPVAVIRVSEPDCRTIRTARSRSAGPPSSGPCSSWGTCPRAKNPSDKFAGKGSDGHESQDRAVSDRATHLSSGLRSPLLQLSYLR